MGDSPAQTKDARKLRTLGAVMVALAWGPGCAHTPATDDGLAADSEATAEEDASSEPRPADPEAAGEAIARLDAASDTWEGTCVRPGPRGLCVAIVAPTSAPDRCGPRMLGEIRVQTRDASSTAKAHADLEAALSDAAGLGRPEDPDLAQALGDARGRAAVLHADADLEAYLRIHVPADLDFYVEEWKQDADDPAHREQYAEQKAKADDSMKRFKAFYAEKNELGEQLMKAYAAVKTTGSAAWTLDAALRTSWIGLHFADELRDAPIPPSLKTDEMKDAYCSALNDQALGPEKIARDAARYCVDRSAELGVATDATSACSDLLARWPADDR